MFKRLIFLTSFVLVLALVGSNVALGDIIQATSASSSDDAEEDVGGSASFEIDLTSSDLELMHDNDPADPLDEQVIGIRFVDVQIPKGKTILNAYVQFDADDINNDRHIGDVHLLINGELSPNPVTFEDVTNSVTSRPTTTAVVEWDPAQWMETHLQSADEATSDISSIIQEIVDQDGWAAGNALVLIFSDNPANPSLGIREAESFDGAGDNVGRRPTLIVQLLGDPFLQADDADGIVSMEAERFNDNLAQGDHTWEMVTATGGFTGLVGMQALPNSGDNYSVGSDAIGNTPRLDFHITFTKTGTHYVWLRAWGEGGSDDSCHTGLDNQYTPLADRVSGFSDNYTWTNEAYSDPERIMFDVPTAGVHTFNIWVREDGAIIDKIVLTTNPDYVPDGDGPAESPGGGSGPVKALGPIPADGDIEVDTLTLEWIEAYTAASNKVYLSTDETIDESDLVGETVIALIAPAIEPGTTYYWRVDAVEADGTVVEGDLWSFTTLALEAHFPSPEDGATEIDVTGTQLSWTAGKGAILHNVYFGTDEAAIAATDMSTSKGMLMETTFDTGPLEPFTTYYWKVDEFAGFTTNPGPVWSFETTKYLVISDDEVTLDYDNSVDPFLSELALDTPPDLTRGGVSDLTLRFHGAPGPGSASLDEATGTYTITGAGADIWGNADNFHYAYRELTGDATITARVVDNGTGSNTWAKGGVMIRQSIEPGSSNVSGFITGGDGDGGTFQWREVQGEGCGSTRTLIVAPPYWVRITRVGNDFTCEMSADGVTWELEGDNPHTVEMTDPVLIGLAVTSHAAGEKRTFVFDNVDIVGNISADDASTDIGIPFNTPEPIYVVLEDSSGAFAAVTHMDPAATTINTWRDWRIPLSEFDGVDLTAVAKLYIGVGDVANPTPGGSGTIRADTIRVVPEGPMAAFAFGSRMLDCPTFNAPSVNYTMVHHESVEAVQYNSDRGYGYEVIYPVDSPFGDRSGYGKFGPFDDSPNNRNNFADECPEELYDSFIGAKGFTNDCNEATMGDLNTPCAIPEGIIFRVDVPNGLYRFVGAFGEADNVHAHRMLAEDGGSGPPENIGPNHVVLVSNHDQAQQTIGEADASKPGEGVFARVGFDGKIPPPGDGVAPSPQFIDMDENGMPTDAGPSSPILEVTQGYIRIHQLQGNSNDGPGGDRDANGGDIVILELWKVESEPAPKTVVFDFETDAQGWGGLKDGTAPTVTDSNGLCLRVTIDEAAHDQQEAGWASPRVFTVDDAVGGINTLSFWYRVDDPDFNGGDFVFHWISSTESWSGGGWYGNGLWGVLIADAQWHQQTADLSILGADAGGWEGTWGDLAAWEFSGDLLYSFEIAVSSTDNTNGSNIYIDDIVFE